MAMECALRDFRGDTLHPSTLDVMHELGLLDALVRRPHQRAATLAADVGGAPLRLADFRHLPTRCHFIAFMPQWDFLDFVAAQAAHWPGFALTMAAQATSLLQTSEHVTGVRVVQGHHPGRRRRRQRPRRLPPRRSADGRLLEWSGGGSGPRV